MLIRLLILLLLTGCAVPTPFQDGDEMTPPPGCVDGRTRGVKC